MNASSWNFTTIIENRLYRHKFVFLRNFETKYERLWCIYIRRASKFYLPWPDALPVPLWYFELHYHKCNQILWNRSYHTCDNFNKTCTHLSISNIMKWIFQTNGQNICFNVHNLKSLISRPRSPSRSLFKI